MTAPSSFRQRNDLVMRIGRWLCVFVAYLAVVGVFAFSGRPSLWLYLALFVTVLSAGRLLRRRSGHVVYVDRWKVDIRRRGAVVGSLSLGTLTSAEPTTDRDGILTGITLRDTAAHQAWLPIGHVARWLTPVLDGLRASGVGVDEALLNTLSARAAVVR